MNYSRCHILSVSCLALYEMISNNIWIFFTDAKEEHLRAYFADCGDIENVRVIRDRRTSLGKGIAYIQFEVPLI